MKSSDPIPGIVRLGYTEREAAFLYIVGANSGFFLGRQYERFARRKHGSILYQLIERGERLGHIRTLDWDRRWKLYHVHSRTVYRLLGHEESRNRHEKSNQEILTRLMVLDYVLDRLPDQFFNGAEEKQAFLGELLGASVGRGVPVQREQLKDCFPIYCQPETAERRTIPQFTYFDYGASTLKAFLRYLHVHRSLWASIGTVELTFASTSECLNAAAQEAFHKLFQPDEDSVLLPNGRKHLMEFFVAEEKWNTNDRHFSQLDMVRLKEGESLYTLPAHDRLRSAWHAGEAQFKAALLANRDGSDVCARFSALLMREPYPSLDVKRGAKPETGEVEEDVQRVSAAVSKAS